MDVRRLAAAVLCAVLLGPPVASAEPPANTLTITGTRNAYAYLTVTKTARYDLRAATVEYTTSDDRTSGRYAGFAIARDAPWLWTMYDPHFEMFDGHSYTDGVLKPGRYRIHLFADGRPVTVKVPWTGPNRTVTATARLDAVVRLADSVVPGADTAVAIEQDGKRGVVTYATMKHHSLVGPQMVLRLCLTRSAASCDRPAGVYTQTQPVGGMGLNGFGTAWGSIHSPTKGLFVRAEVNGPTVGFLGLATLRYYPPPDPRFPPD